jgi:O-methyltransferase
MEFLRSAIRPRARLRELRFRRLYRKYQRFTMINPADFVANLRIAYSVLQSIPGAVIECGTWRGGMSAALMEIGGPDRDYYFFDSFEGLPPAREIDGQAAIEWQRNTSAPDYYNNCTASLEEFQAAIALAKCPHVHIFRGFFEHTFPEFSAPPIAVLRLDADFYESTTICLEKFWNFVAPGGVILIDDYYAWDGCSRAVHDFLSNHSASERISRESAQLAVIIKHPAEKYDHGC